MAMDVEAASVADTGIPAEYRALAKFFDDFVDEADHWESRTAPYHELVTSIYTSLIRPTRGSSRSALDAATCLPRSSRPEASAST